MRPPQVCPYECMEIDDINISIIHPLLLGKNPDILGELYFRQSTPYPCAQGGFPHQVWDVFTAGKRLRAAWQEHIMN